MESVLEDALVLVCEGEINNVNIILPILKACHESYSGKPLLIIAGENGVVYEALGTAIINTVKKSFITCCVKAPGFGDRRKEMLSDIAVLTGATVVSDDTGLKLENFSIDWLGFAQRVVTTKNNCTIIRGKGDIEKVERRVAEIRATRDLCVDAWDKEKQSERLAKLISGVAIISVGAPTEAEMKEKKDRVEDALSATRAAVQEGIVAGGGVAILRAAQKLDTMEIPEEFEHGARIVRNAAEEPLRRIVSNAGFDPTEVRLKVLQNESLTFGFNARTGRYEDLVESGVLDAAKIIRCSLQNAASVAGLVLTTECMIADESDENVEV
jgi:chaperonin GroEL